MPDPAQLGAGVTCNQLKFQVHANLVYNDRSRSSTGQYE